MEYLLTSDQMKLLDNNTIDKIGIASSVLMEKAALSVVSAIDEECANAKNILVVSGIGNNGGDGIAIGRILHLQGRQVRIVVIGDRQHSSPETKKQIEIAEKYNIKIYNTFDKNEYNVIVDSVFGIGLTRSVEGQYKKAIHFINQAKGFKIAVDIPSGISADTGKIMGCAVKADLTVAIAYKKLGHVFYPGAQYCNRIKVADIGVYGADEICFNFSYNKKDLDKLPQRLNDSNKGTFGKALIIAGSNNMSGAAYLASIAAYKMGCGLVRIFTPLENREILQTLIPEAVLTTYDTKQFSHKSLEDAIAWADVINIGPGLGMSDIAKQILETVLKKHKCPLVIDADGINLLAKYEQLLTKNQKNIIITPHMKEMSRLSKRNINDIKNNLIENATEMAKKYKLICVLKDSRTIVADYNKKVYINQSGNNGMAKAGSGDVLSGIITGLLAQKMKPFESAALGVYIHGVSGDEASNLNGCYSTLARDIAMNITRALH